MTLGSSAGISLECSFDISDWGYTYAGAYNCFKENYIYTNEDLTVDSVNGTHKNDKSNLNVTGIHLLGGTIHYIPKGLQNIFKNLIGLKIESAGMKEVHQSDLSVFPKLIYLDLYNNKIEVIEEDLFAYNPDLTYISLSFNLIKNIHPDVFNHLSKLSYFWISNNKCIDIDAYQKQADVEEALKEIKLKCPTPTADQKSMSMCQNYWIKEVGIIQNVNDIQDFNQFDSNQEIHFNKKIVVDIQNLNCKLRRKFSKHEERLDTIDDMMEGTIERLDYFSSNSMPEIMQNFANKSFISAEKQVIKNLEKTVANLTDIFQKSQEEVLDEKIEWKLAEMQGKILKMIDTKIRRLERNIMGKIDKSVKDLEEKLEKVFKALNIENS